MVGPVRWRRPHARRRLELLMKPPNPHGWPRLGFRGDYLFWLSLLYLGLGWSIIFYPNLGAASIYAPLFRLMPHWVYGLFWVVPGAIGVVQAARRRSVAKLAFMLHVSVAVGWALALFLAVFAGGNPRGLVLPAIFLVFARLSYRVAGWPEPRMPQTDDQPP